MGFHRFARGRHKAKVGMNSFEKSYAQYLQQLLFAKEIVWFEFDAIKLRLADKTFYSPDFFLLNKNHELEVREVKGFWEDDARVKIKVAARLFPFRFVAVTFDRKTKSWVEENFSGTDDVIAAG